MPRLQKVCAIDHTSLSIHEQVVPKMIDAGTLLLTSSTSKGVILQKFYFNNEFCILVSLAVR